MATFVSGEVVTAAKLNQITTDINSTKRSWYATTNTTDQTGISAVADITGLSVTWTADATRLYRISVNVGLFKATTANFGNVHITDASNVIKLSRSVWMAISDYSQVAVDWIESGLSGSVTRKARADAGSGTINIINSFTRNGIIMVEDIGPV